MPAAKSEADHFITLQRYTHVWEVGTGLKVSLAPGKYRVTGEETVNGLVFIHLDGGYRIDAHELLSAASELEDE